MLKLSPEQLKKLEEMAARKRGDYADIYSFLKGAVAEKMKQEAHQSAVLPHEKAKAIKRSQELDGLYLWLSVAESTNGGTGDVYDSFLRASTKNLMKKHGKKPYSDALYNQASNKLAKEMIPQILKDQGMDIKKIVQADAKNFTEAFGLPDGSWPGTAFDTFALGGDHVSLPKDGKIGLTDTLLNAAESSMDVVGGKVSEMTEPIEKKVTESLAGAGLGLYDTFFGDKKSQGPASPKKRTSKKQAPKKLPRPAKALEDLPAGQKKIQLEQLRKKVASKQAIPEAATLAASILGKEAVPGALAKLIPKLPAMMPGVAQALSATNDVIGFGDHVVNGRFHEAMTEGLGIAASMGVGGKAGKLMKGAVAQRAAEAIVGKAAGDSVKSIAQGLTGGDYVNKWGPPRTLPNDVDLKKTLEDKDGHAYSAVDVDGTGVFTWFAHNDRSDLMGARYTEVMVGEKIAELNRDYVKSVEKEYATKARRAKAEQKQVEQEKVKPEQRKEANLSPKVGVQTAPKEATKKTTAEKPRTTPKNAQPAQKPIKKTAAEEGVALPGAEDAQSIPVAQAALAPASPPLSNTGESGGPNANVSNEQLLIVMSQIQASLSQLVSHLAQPTNITVDVQNGNIVAAVNAANSQQQRRS
ncbi:hypothetical protein HA052_08165 [Chromobacterium haemolyticum]|uniref:Uncharacterized protein n=1 Tax=Chromobacterium fluminis TaxID=3044269 RepID=A0ABX0L7V1_9NEIS|nr:hypothetical protein [Chromobacterium haemolyticum]NHR05173.1 hypothetical protein [Chromobacterium haemolyticum]